MAHGAGFVVAMLVELLANRRRTANVRLDGGHVFRRRFRRDAHDAIEHPLSTEHGRSRRAVGGDLEHARVSEHAAAVRALGQRHLPKLLPAHAGDAVVLGEPLIQQGEVRLDEVAHAEVALQQLLEKRFRLARHGHFQQLVELRIEFLVGRGEINLPQLEPLAEEVRGEGAGLRAGEHSLDLRAQDLRFAQRALIREAQQLEVGHRAPEKIGKARGHREVVQPSRCLLEKQKPGRGEHRLVSHAHRFLERGALL